MNWRVARVVWYDLKCPRSSVDRVLASGARDRSSNLRGGTFYHQNPCNSCGGFVILPLCPVVKPY